MILLCLVVKDLQFFISRKQALRLLFSSSAQLSMKFQLLINAEIVKISGKFRFKPQKLVIYPAHKC